MRYCSLLLVLMLAACANQPPNGGKVLVTTVENEQAIEGVNCVVSNNGQRWEIVTPETVTVGAADGELRILCNKEGYLGSELRIPPATKSGSGSGISLGGMGGGAGSAVGVGLSLPVGRSGRGHYPPDITVNMTRQ